MLYLSSAGNVEASVSLGSAGTLGQHSISMRKIILLACCDLAFVRTALKSPEYGYMVYDRVSLSWYLI